MANQPKFVSSIPNNKLEPVYLGGTPQTNSAPKSNGVFVPSILRGEKDTIVPKAQVVPQVTEETFPSLMGPAIKASTPFLGYANALKKPVGQIVKPVSMSSNISTSSKTSAKPITTSQYSEYSDSDSCSEDSNTFLDNRY
jgi:hypothetical protein